ncbi:MAG: Fic family protein [Deltaproteobacteria bacterium]|nr:Fic family protein [Deltaproteobacteria bacterium]
MNQDIISGANDPLKWRDEPLRVDTHRSGPFVFQIGVDPEAIRPLFDRVLDAHRRLLATPILPDLARKLDREVRISGIYGTNTIEGADLSREETEIAFDAPPERAAAEAQQRVANLKEAYAYVEEFGEKWTAQPFASPLLPIHEEDLKELHQLITQGLSDDPDNIPGQYRNNPKSRLTRVGDKAHGGVYTPPKCLADIERLVPQFLGWVSTVSVQGRLMPLLRAPLVHYYVERIHPFWDGNGRVGRCLESMALRCAGYRFSAEALSNDYLEHLDEYYVAFRASERAEEQKHPYPNTPFVTFFLESMLRTLNRLQDRVNELLRVVLFQNYIHTLLAQKKINARQHTLLTLLLEKGEQPLDGLLFQPWYVALYRNRTARTRDRDLQGLAAQKLIELTGTGARRTIRPIFP